MKILVILAHPDNQSFNHAVANKVMSCLNENQHQIYFHDLYSEKFDPLLIASEIPKEAVLPPEIRLYCNELFEADGIVIIHPNWWGQPPAILKGWVDRVIRPGIAYKFEEGDAGEGKPIGLLKAKAAVVFNTSNTETEREIKVFGDPLETLWKNCTFNLCGVSMVYRETFNVVITSTLEQRRRWLNKVKEIINCYFPK